MADHHHRAAQRQRQRVQLVAELEATRAKQAHPQTPSERFAAFHKAIESAVIRTADERAERDREQRDATVYHRTAESQPKGS